MIRIRYDQRLIEVDPEIPIDPSDEQVRVAVAEFLQIPVAKLVMFTVEREGNDFTLRPEIATVWPERWRV
jgi:hypothetical protein